MPRDDTELWREPEGTGACVCVMISCCAGAELQIRRGDEIVLRELYPDKATLYERAAELRRRYAEAWSSADPGLPAARPTDER